MNKLMDFGIAVNFFGNYAQEANKLQDLNEKIFNGFNRLKQLVVGGAIAYGFQRVGDAIMNTAKSMEQNFATLTASLGSTTKALQNLEWARKKGAETPFGIEEVNSAIGMMTSMGFNKNDKMREDTFKSIGDFAGLKGFDFSDMMQRVAKAGFGNWESLGDQFGIRRQTIGGMVREQIGRTPDRFKGEEASIAKAIQLVEKGTAGTEAYRMAVVQLIGVLGRDGMMERLNTLSGAMANIDDIFQNFMFKMVGYTQIQGTLANTIKNTVVERILNPLTESHKNSASALGEMTNSVDQLGRIGQAIGQILISVWDSVDDSVGSMVGNIVLWIDKLDVFFSDFQNNVAPIILFLYLIRLEVEEFLAGFADGFITTFKFFVGVLWTGLQALGDFALWLGIGETKAEALGRVLGLLSGTLVGIAMIKFVASQFTPLIVGAKMVLAPIGQVLVLMDRLIFKQRIFNGLHRMAAGNVRSGWILMSGAITRFAQALIPAISGAWAFAGALLANPITWIVIGVMALIAGLTYLIVKWDEVGASMQSIGDGVLVFLPLVGIPLLIAKHWESFKNTFMNIWTGLGFWFKAKWLWLKNEVIFPMIGTITAPFVAGFLMAKRFGMYIIEKFPFLKTIFAGILVPITLLVTGFKNMWDFVKKIWDMLMNSNFVGTLSKWAEKLSGIFASDSEEDYKEKLRKYDPEKYKEEYGETVTKTLSPPRPATIAGSVDNSQDKSTSVTVTGNTIVAPYKPEDYVNNMVNMAKRGGKRDGG